ncbi:MAG: single-stranded DNA-binding protein, partial [Candidatus Hydrogenedens sp.]|nr:single-stranded DNA-binding protein [Candidatus Hydrogenedens sp.]
ASQQLRKGRPVLVEGRLRLDEWEDRATGQRRSRLEIVAWRVSPLDWVPAEGESFDVEEFPPDEERGSYPDASPNQGKVPPQNNINHFPEDDVPF